MKFASTRHALFRKELSRFIVLFLVMTLPTLGLALQLLYPGPDIIGRAAFFSAFWALIAGYCGFLRSKALPAYLIWSLVTLFCAALLAAAANPSDPSLILPDAPYAQCLQSAALLLGLLSLPLTCSDTMLAIFLRSRGIAPPSILLSAGACLLFSALLLIPYALGWQLSKRKAEPPAPPQEGDAPTA